MIERTLSASSVFDEIYILGQSKFVSKLTFEKKGSNPGFFEGHWWKKSDLTDVSIYLSSHSGCPVGCKMCGTNGRHVRPATSEEMIDQFEFMHRKMFSRSSDESLYRARVCKFLYMGEPLLNLFEVDKTIRYIADEYPEWTILISTTGPRIDYEVVQDWVRDYGSQILISFSVHRLDDNARNNLIPYNNKLTINEIISVGESIFSLNPNSKVSFSYNLFNRDFGKELAESMARTFSTDKWIPCIQYLYDKNGRDGFLHRKESNDNIDRFIGELKDAGFNDVYGFYAPMVGENEHLNSGCGQFIEFQSYIKRMNL